MPVIGQASHKQPELLPMATDHSIRFRIRHMPLPDADVSGSFFEVLNMNTILIANFVSLVGCVLMVCVGFLRKKKQILAVQCVQFGFLAAGNLILGAFSGFISGVVSIVRNLVVTRFHCTVPMKLAFIGVQMALSARAVLGSPIEWLPVASGFLFTWFIDAKSEITLKWAIIAAQAMWMVYDFAYQNYVAMTFDIFTMLSNLVGIQMIRKSAKA